MGCVLVNEASTTVCEYKCANEYCVNKYTFKRHHRELIMSKYETINGFVGVIWEQYRLDSKQCVGTLHSHTHKKRLTLRESIRQVKVASFSILSAEMSHTWIAGKPVKLAY